jgi:hypothetical protein
MDPTENAVFYRQECVFSDPLASNGCPIVAYVCVAGMCLPTRCLAIDIQVTISSCEVLSHSEHGYLCLTHRPIHNRYYLSMPYLLATNSITNFLTPGTKIAQYLPKFGIGD